MFERPESINSREEVVERVRMDPVPEEIDAIRNLWKKHSIAEDSRDIKGLLATLTTDCIYELVNTGDRWIGHEGAEAFYTGLLTAFPDIKFHLTNIVVGPQGVWEEAVVFGTQHEDWLRYPASGQVVEFNVSIYFPWDSKKKKFCGERIYSTMG